ncbi:MAG: DUF1835 domain-containing protein [Rhodothermales bacterium]|nr:DUF1835 domain-containing protein [Rhodothermales bacterium]
MASRRLIVTNGSAAVGRIRASFIPADHIIAWSDVLHEGPVRIGLSSKQLRNDRARYLSAREFGEFDSILAEMSERDDMFVRGLTEYDEVVLWFEHDLYDQLQLIQALDGIASRFPVRASVYLVCRSQFVGESSVDALRAAFEGRVPIGTMHLREAADAWAAFRDERPVRLNDIVTAGSSKVLPFLADALHRLLEELPHPQTGLSRSERQILESLRVRPATPPVLFRMCQEQEEAKFMGDTSFWSVLIPLLESRRPLVEPERARGVKTSWNEAGFLTSELRITDAGRAVAAGRSNLLDHLSIDRWLGGTHLTNTCHWTYGDLELAGPCSRSFDKTADEPRSPSSC